MQIKGNETQVYLWKLPLSVTVSAVFISYTSNNNNIIKKLETSFQFMVVQDNPS